MIDINKEAEEYGWKKKNPFSVQLLANELVLATKTDFIAGANSKYVQAKIIQAKIDVLKQHIEHPTKPGYRRHDVLNSIKEFQQQLKQLEDEKHN